MATIEERLGRLERSVRGWRIGATILAVAGGSALAIGAARTEKEIRADRIIAGEILLDSDKAKGSAAWMFHDGYPVLHMFGDKEKEDAPRVTLGVFGGGKYSMLMMNDVGEKSANVLLHAGTNKDGSSTAVGYFQATGRKSQVKIQADSAEPVLIKKE